MRGRRWLRRHWRLLLLAALLATGLTLALLQPFDREQLVGWGEALSSNPWTVPLLLAVQVTLFALGMPGTLMLWVIAPLYSLFAASALLVTGSVAGAAAAYHVARVLGAAGTDSPGRRRVYAILARRADFLTQCALRVLPGFPHSAVNFAGGLLRLPLATFLAATAVGLAVKWPLYVYAVQGLLAVDGERRPAATVAPLLALAVFLGLGGWLRRRFSRRMTGGDHD